MASFLSDAYEPLPEVVDCLSAAGAVAVSEIDDGFFPDGPGESDALVFYPGAKVEAAAYIPLMYRFAEDGVLNRVKLRSGESLLPADAATVAIEGGNHAQFGCYGPQKGDGMPLISAEEQREETAEAVPNMIPAQ